MAETEVRNFNTYGWTEKDEVGREGDITDPLSVVAACATEERLARN